MEDSGEGSRTLERITFESRFADVNPEARARGKRVAAVHHSHGREADKILPNLSLLSAVNEAADLLRQEVRARSVYVKARDAANRSFARVWRHPDAGCFRRGRHLP